MCGFERETKARTTIFGVSYCGWPKSISHSLKTMVEASVSWYLNWGIAAISLDFATIRICFKMNPSKSVFFWEQPSAFCAFLRPKAARV